LPSVIVFWLLNLLSEALFKVVPQPLQHFLDKFTAILRRCNHRRSCWTAAKRILLQDTILPCEMKHCQRTMVILPPHHHFRVHKPHYYSALAKPLPQKAHFVLILLETVAGHPIFNLLLLLFF
jgi:hypothetical protein